MDKLCVTDREKCEFRNDRTWRCSAIAQLRLVCAMKRIRDDNAACICGCPAEDHEQLGEDGEQCEHEDHECLRTCQAIASMFAEMRSRAVLLQAELDGHSLVFEAVQENLSRALKDEAKVEELERDNASLRVLLDATDGRDLPECDPCAAAGAGE